MQRGVSCSCLGKGWYPNPTTPPVNKKRVTIKSAAILLEKKKREMDMSKIIIIRCSSQESRILKTCKICKTQFHPSLNNPLACRFHTSHFGGETKRKFESVHTGGTMNTPNSGQVLEYWHCCGSEDPFHPGCTSSPHLSYDDD